MPGVVAMLESLSHPRCVASSGPLAKILQALEISGLAPYFGGHLFSSCDVGIWKPAPGLFLWAAQEMGFTPSQCAVIERIAMLASKPQSPPKAFRYLPKGPSSAHQDATAFCDMSHLNEKIAGAWA
jgi:haloacid dehalogenase-like hydrolase